MFDYVFGHNSVKNAFKTDQRLFTQDTETVYLNAKVIRFEKSIYFMEI